MNNSNAKLFQSSKTIFTTKDLAIVWGETDKKNLKSKISYYVKQKSLVSLSRGIFAKNSEYDPKELVTSVYVPSYISFETVLRESGIIFQHYEAIFAVSKLTRTMSIDKFVITYRRIKDSVLFNSSGVIHKDNYSIATPERAFLDTIYLFPNFYFDNLKQIDWDKCFEIVKIYDNKEMVKRLIKYQKNNVK